MSRRGWWAILAVAVSSPVAAQSAGPGSAQDVLAKEAAAPYGPPDTRTAIQCPEQKPGAEIVVCAELEEQSQFRVKSSGDLDPTGAGARDGIPRAPDLEKKYPGPVVARGCFIPPCPPPMPPIIDLKAIPEAPPGSDADRVANGLAPTGRDSPAPPPPDLPAVREEDVPPTSPGSA